MWLNRKGEKKRLELTCQKTNSDAHISPIFAFDETPSIVELGLGCDMPRSELGLVLRFENLEFGWGKRGFCICCVGEGHRWLFTLEGRMRGYEREVEGYVCWNLSRSIVPPLVAVPESNKMVSAMRLSNVGRQR